MQRIVKIQNLIGKQTIFLSLNCSNFYFISKILISHLKKKKNFDKKKFSIKRKILLRYHHHDE
jgi:hypothetical protein